MLAEDEANKAEERALEEQRRRPVSAWELAQSAVDKDEEAHQKEEYEPKEMKMPETKSASQLAAEAIAKEMCIRDSSYTAQNIGAEKEERISQGYRMGNFMIIVIAVILCLFLEIAHKPLIALFLDNAASSQTLSLIHIYSHHFGH